jgi:competence protein ComEC
MKSVLRNIALVIPAVVLLAGCSSPNPPTQQVTTPTQTTSPQPSSAAMKSPATALIPPTVPDGTLTVHFIDVGQGDSELIRTPSGATMLIDGGDTNTGVVQYLKSKGITRLDMG